MNPMFQPPVDRVSLVNALIFMPDIFQSFVTIPEPFPIPEFREDTQQRLDIGRFTQDDRLYMVRTLACMLCVFKPRPSTRDCEIVAQSLVNKYPFLMSVVGVLF